jgi:hypothetical protein
MSAADRRLAEHEVLLREIDDAREAVLRTRASGNIGGAALRVLREQALREASQRLREWEAANNWQSRRR